MSSSIEPYLGVKLICLMDQFSLRRRDSKQVMKDSLASLSQRPRTGGVGNAVVSEAHADGANEDRFLRGRTHLQRLQRFFRGARFGAPGLDETRHKGRV